MRVTEATTNLAVTKALYKKPKQIDANGAKSGQKKPLQTKLLTAGPIKDAPVKLTDLTSVRAKNSNNTLRNLLNEADTVLAHQERLIKDVNQLLGMGKTIGVYKETALEG